MSLTFARTHDPEPGFEVAYAGERLGFVSDYEAACFDGPPAVLVDRMVQRARNRLRVRKFVEALGPRAAVRTVTEEETLPWLRGLSEEALREAEREERRGQDS